MIHGIWGTPDETDFLKLESLSLTHTGPGSPNLAHLLVPTPALHVHRAWPPTLQEGGGQGPQWPARVCLWAQKHILPCCSQEGSRGWVKPNAVSRKRIRRTFGSPSTECCLITLMLEIFSFVKSILFCLIMGFEEMA